MSVIEQLRHLDGKALRKQSDAYDLVLDWLSRGKQITVFYEAGPGGYSKYTVIRMVELDGNVEHAAYFKLWEEMPDTPTSQDIMFGLYEVQPVTRMVIKWESVDDDRYSVGGGGE